MLSVVIPTYNSAVMIAATLAPLQASDLVSQIVISDGGSIDETCNIAASYGVDLVTGQKGRGAQLKAGAQAATQNWILFLHADTSLSEGWQDEVAHFIGETENRERAAYFIFALDEHSPPARRLEKMVAWRCRHFALPYGDQGLLIQRDFYHDLGGFGDLPLMEDVDLVRRIGRKRLVGLKSRAITSSVRYQKSGYLRRSLRNLCCLSLFFLGVPPHWIVKLYG